MAASRADVLCLVTSSILALTGLNWISVKQRHSLAMCSIETYSTMIFRELRTSVLEGIASEECEMELNSAAKQEMRWSHFSCQLKADSVA